MTHTGTSDDTRNGARKTTHNDATHSTCERQQPHPPTSSSSPVRRKRLELTRHPHSTHPLLRHERRPPRRTRQLGDADHLGIADSEKPPASRQPPRSPATWNPDLARQMGEALGAEARGLGVNVLLGPGLNIKRSPLCGRNFEYLSEDPILVGRMAAGLTQGIQSTGTAACPKHFAANSQELRRMESDSIVDERTLREIYLTGSKSCAAAPSLEQS